jgi:hypothetical protein
MSSVGFGVPSRRSGGVKGLGVINEVSRLCQVVRGKDEKKFVVYLKSRLPIPAQHLTTGYKQDTYGRGTLAVLRRYGQLIAHLQWTGEQKPVPGAQRFGRRFV